MRLNQTQNSMGQDDIGQVRANKVDMNKSSVKPASFYTDNAPWLLVACVFFLPISTFMTNLLAGLAALSCLMSGDVVQKLKFSLSNPYSQGVLGFLALFLIGGLYTEAPLPDIWQSYQDILKLSLVILFIPLIGLNVNDKMLWFKRTCYALILAMVVTLVFSVLKEGFGLPIGQKYTNAAVFKNYIKTNFFMAFATFLLAHVAWVEKKVRPVALILIAVMTYYIFFASIGRTGYATYAILALLFAWQRFRKEGIALVVAGLLCIGALGYQYSPNFHWRLFQIKEEIMNHDAGIKNTSVGSRLEFLRNSLVLISEHPIIGSGAGSFKEKYKEKVKGTNNVLTDNPHSEYLHLGVEFGAMGLLVLFYFCTQLVVGARKLPTEPRYVAEGLIVSFIIGSLANSWLMDFTECMFLVLMGSFSYAFLNLRKNEST